MQDYDEAIRLDPGSAEARNNSGSPANPRSVEHQSGAWFASSKWVGVIPLIVLALLVLAKLGGTD